MRIRNMTTTRLAHSAVVRLEHRLHGPSDRGDVPGRYVAETDLGMSGGWKLRLDWDGPVGRGTAAFDVTLD